MLHSLRPEALFSEKMDYFCGEKFKVRTFLKHKKVEVGSKYEGIKIL